MKKLIKDNLWLISAVLYPLSWVTYSGPNVSFLAWIAFVPLFVFLHQHRHNFKKFFGASLAVTTSWTLSTSSWLFHFPTPKWQIVLTIFSETLHISLPFLFLYLIQKKTSYSKALMLFPFIWVAWEWLYIPLQHTMGTHLLPYAQGNNLWLIQMADLGGMWLVSFWVMAFNIVTYFALKTHNFQLRSKEFGKTMLKVGLLMILPPLVYGTISMKKWAQKSEKSLQVSVVPTQFEPDYLMDEDMQKAVIEQTLHRTDSLAFDLLNNKNGSDLYVWPETGSSYWMAFQNITSILHEATTDWSGSLLTGCKGIPVEGDDQNAHVSAVMVSPVFDSSEVALQYHHKTVLGPGAETIPYREIIKPFLDSSYRDQMFYLPGKSFEPLELKTKDGELFRPGISLCYEQWFPSVWTKQAKNGAEFFVHMAAEGWYGSTGYAQFMGNVSRFRAIETRRSVVRSSNKGLSMFINSKGQIYKNIAYGSLDMATAEIYTSTELTWFCKYPNAVPILCLLVLFIVVAVDSIKGVLQ